MTFKGKQTRIIFGEDAREQFEELNKKAGEELLKGITKSDHQILLNSIKQKIEFLRDNPQYGIHIPKDRIPKEYIEKYEVNNLWKVNLPNVWRMIYTIRSNEIEIISLILDIFNHKDYEKKFGYKKS